uniref:Uncharacterized protein n=1 Tax=Plectus sambesii TaxID=2011161 RepID=A0A914XQH7_9BILA
MTAIRSSFKCVPAPENVSLPDYFLQEIDTFGDSPAFIWPKTEEIITFADLRVKIKQLCAGLQILGLKKGDVCGTFMGNNPEFVMLFLAAQRLGVVVTTCNPAYTPAKPGDYAILPQIHPKEDLAFILYSSGTTGLPKGVMTSHYGFVANLHTIKSLEYANDEMLLLDKNDTVMGVLPFFHAGGIITILFMLLQGAKIVINTRFEPQEFLAMIQKYQVTTLNLVPPVIVFLAKSPLVDKYDLKSLKNIYIGAAPVPMAVADEARKRLNIHNLIQLFGMTELGIIAFMSPVTAQSRMKDGTCGVLMPGLECKVIDPVSGKVCGPMDDGELWIKSPSVMKGYLRNPVATKETLMPGGWLRTGDIGHYDSDHYFFIVDRLKELIKVRGWQVAPAEIEAVLLRHKSVGDCSVIGIPDLYSGELPRAYIILKAGENASAEEITEFVKGHVSSYKQLAGGVEFVTDLPKTASGKVLRRVLLQRYKEKSAKTKSAKL